MEDNQGLPDVTVLIVSRNAASALHRCLEALERSVERERFEILVVDSGSRDGSAELATLKLPKHFGRTKALNIGIRTAKGRFVLLLDPYTEVMPDTVSRLAARLAEDSEVGAVCPYVETVYLMPAPDQLLEVWKSGNLEGARPVDAAGPEVAVEYPRGAPIMVRREFLKGMNYFDERFGEHWSDLELCWQLRNAGKRIVVLPGVRVSSATPPAPAWDAVESADSAAGLAAYLSKHHGWVSGLKFKVAAGLYLLGKVLTFQNTGYNASRLGALVRGQKIDGTQA